MTTAAEDAANPDKICCLVGSSRFKTQFHELGERLEKQGWLVLMMAFFQHADNRPVSDDERMVLEVVDRRRIDMCRDVWVINPRVCVCATYAVDLASLRVLACRIVVGAGGVTGCTSETRQTRRLPTPRAGAR
jgi:hypothetical protein